MTQPLNPPTNALFLRAEYAAAHMGFQARNPSLLLDLSPSQALTLLEAIKIAVAQVNCPDLSRELLVETAEAVQRLFADSAMLDRMTGCELQEIVAIRDRARGLRRIDPIERSR